MLADLEDFANVGMIESGRRHRFEAETLPRIWIGSQARRQDLDGDLTIEARVARAVHHAHAALADRAENFVGTKASSSS